MAKSPNAPKTPKQRKPSPAPKAPRARTTLTLTDPRAIRAIAHEARQQVIDELYNGSVLTATEAAQLCGLSPSAMSYHLRALEKWGIVVRDTTPGDRRERPWRAAASYWNVNSRDTTPSASMRQAVNAIMSMFMIGLNKAVDSWLESDPQAQAKGASTSRSRLYLTDEEAAALNRELDEMVERYDTGRTSRNKPANASAWQQYWLLLPSPPRRGQ